ncbi:MAG: TolC family protein [Pseudomonadota bacterium]
MTLGRRALAALAARALAAGGAQAQKAGPLTLEQALAAADDRHPEMRVAAAERDIAAAERDVAVARDDLRVIAGAALRQSRPALRAPGEDFLPDNSVFINVRKRLYDFGRADALAAAGDATVQARDAGLIDARSRQRIEIMARFFDVLLADKLFTVENEYMAVAYVRFDDARQRLDVGQIPQVEVAALEARYQGRLVRRNAAQKRQRITRALLANAMNRPGELAPDLADPGLPQNALPLPEYEKLLPVMYRSNPRMGASARLLEASRQRMEVVRSDLMPRVDLDLEAGDYSLETRTRNNLSAGVMLTWPLYDGTRSSAELNREQAAFYKLQAEADRLKMILAQSLLETLIEVEQLKRTVIDARARQVQHRDLALEKARGEYEMELKTNLGDSMAATVEARMEQRRAEYELALARLEALVGQPLERLAGGEGTQREKP